MGERDSETRFLNSRMKSCSHIGPRGGHRPKMWPFFIAIKNIESNYIFHLEFKTFYRIWLSSLVLEISYFKVSLFYQNAGVLFHRFSVKIYLLSSGKMANVTKILQYGSQNVNVFSWYKRMDNLTYKKIDKIMILQYTFNMEDIKSKSK